jgi:predicted dehydrogenase
MATSPPSSALPQPSAPPSSISGQEQWRAAGAHRPIPKKVVRLGFLGLGWIGLTRMKSAAQDANVEIGVIADPSPGARQRGAEVASQALVVERLEDLLAEPIDGVVIATPSGQHAEQAYAALQRGIPVFCQKPLARTTCETYRVINLARAQNVLLGIDYCYRHLAGMAQLRALVRSGAIGKLCAIELTFHNAYGPDKAWACDIRQSGGGCVIDLATHLVDLALWASGDRPATHVSSHLFRDGQLLPLPAQQVEDTAYAQWLFADGVHTQLACSWNASRGCGAEIRVTFVGSEGATMLSNLNGSFYDFAVEFCRGTSCERLAVTSDDWGGRALMQWVNRLHDDPGYDPDVERGYLVADIVDSIYGR